MKEEGIKKGCIVVGAQEACAWWAGKWKWKRACVVLFGAYGFHILGDHQIMDCIIQLAFSAAC